MKRLLFFLLLLSGGCISIASEVILFDGRHPITYQLPEKVSPAADSCGIVIGTSHCEPLLRNNVGEWAIVQAKPKQK